MRLLPLIKTTVAAAFCVSAAAHALDYRSVNETGTVFYSAPSNSSKKLFLVSQYFPVEVVLVENDWARVRDATGQMAWVPQAKLSNKRYVLVNVASATVRTEASDAASVALVAERNVALELLDAPVSDWLKVRHDGKTTGYVRLQDVWGI